MPQGTEREEHLKGSKGGDETSGRMPAMLMYMADLERDLGPLSDAAAGLWMKMLCRMHASPRRGYLLHPNGEPFTKRDILTLSSDHPKTAGLSLSELERKGVYSLEGLKTVFSRRMVRDQHLKDVRTKAVNSRMDRQASENGGVFVGTKALQTLYKPSTKPHARDPARQSSSVRDDDDDDKGLQNFADLQTEPAAGGRVVEALIPEIAELLAGFSGDPAGKLQGKPAPKVVREVAELLGAKFGTVGEAAAVYPAFITARFKASPPRFWKWFTAVTRNAITEGEL